jgi:hypothetical protein
VNESLTSLVEAWLRNSPHWREHPGEASPWEDLRADPRVDRVRLSPDLAMVRQMTYEGLAEIEIEE